MSISNRSDLRAQIADYLGDRSDLTASQLNQAIALAEAEFNRKLRVLGNEDETDLTLNAKVVSLPSDFKGIRRLYIDSNPQITLQYMSADNFWRRDAGSDNGLPCIFTVQGDKSAVTKSIVLSPTPDSSYTGKLLYFGKFALSDDSSTNTILTNHQDLYLYGALKHAFILLQDYEAAALMDNQMMAIIKQIDIDDNQERIGTKPLQAYSTYREAPYTSYRA